MKIIIYFLLPFLISFQIKSQERPNIIFILADDLGAGDLHITGHPYAKTPNLDKLAESGVRFEKAYMAAAWCAPSRYALMSGQYPARSFNQTHNLNPKEPSVTSVLQNAGYRIAHFGKWHLTTGKDFAKQPEDFGLEKYFLTNWKGEEIEQTWSKDERSQEFWRAHTTDRYVDMAIDFIEKNEEDRTQPFYMNLWVYPTHSYIHPTPEQLEVYKGLEVDYNDFSPHQRTFLRFVSEHGDINRAMQAYCADITAMDKALGRLFDYLKEKDIEKNTVVVFTSDNGPGPLTTQIANRSVIERYKDRPDLLNSVGSAKHFKDRKLSQNEGGIRVPFIVSWPGKFATGIVDSESNIQGVDWLPTVATICKVKLPDSKYDGIDITSAFLGKGVERPKPLFWKEKDQSSILIGNMKGYAKGGSFELYDLSKDPAQLTDLSNSNPETATLFREKLEEWIITIDETR